MQPIWQVMQHVLNEIASNHDNLLKAINQAEEALEKQSFLQRTIALKIVKTI